MKETPHTQQKETTLCSLCAEAANALPENGPSIQMCFSNTYENSKIHIHLTLLVQKQLGDYHQ